MYPKHIQRRGYHPIECFDPDDGQTCDLLVNNKDIAVAPKLGRWYTPTLAECVPATVKHPKAVYRGLKRDDDSTIGYCYIGQPPHKFPGGKKAPVKTTEFFFVFVSEERVIYEWRWEECSPNQMLNLANGPVPRFHARLHP